MRASVPAGTNPRPSSRGIPVGWSSSRRVGLRKGERPRCRACGPSSWRKPSESYGYGVSPTKSWDTASASNFCIDPNMHGGLRGLILPLGKSSTWSSSAREEGLTSSCRHFKSPMHSPRSPTGFRNWRGVDWVSQRSSFISWSTWIKMALP